MHFLSITLFRGGFFANQHMLFGIPTKYGFFEYFFILLWNFVIFWKMKIAITMQIIKKKKMPFLLWS